MALSIHPSADPPFLQSMSLAEERANHFVKLASHVLPLFEAAPRWTRVATSRRNTSSVRQQFHDWHNHPTLGYQCRRCLQLGGDD
eukprot:8749679-Pyramimonas_sp.AAC.1